VVKLCKKDLASVVFLVDDCLLSSAHELVASGAERSAPLATLRISRMRSTSLTQVLSDLVLRASDLKFSSMDVENPILVHKKHSKLSQVLEFSQNLALKTILF